MLALENADNEYDSKKILLSSALTSGKLFSNKNLLLKPFGYRKYFLDLKELNVLSQ